MTPRRLTLGAWLLILGLTLSIAAAMIHYPMTWGLIDDHTNLNYIRVKWRGWTLAEVLDRESMLWWYRPVYILFVYVAYDLFEESPRAFYVANLMFVMGCCVPWVWLLRRQIPADSMPFVAPLCSLMLFAATPLYHLVVFLSLQEKFVILFGGLAVGCLSKAMEVRGSPWRRLGFHAAGILSLLLGLWSKPTALATVPWIMLAIALAGEGTLRLRIGAAAAWMVPVLFMTRSFLRSDDPYPVRYWDRWGDKFSHMNGDVALFLAIAVAAGAVLAWRWRARRESAGALAPRLLWPVSLAAYLVMVIPWGLQTYNWSPAMPLAAGCLVWMGREALALFPGWRRWAPPAALGLAAAAALFLVFTKAIPRLQRQSEITHVVRWLSEHLPAPDVDIYVIEPAIEATGALQYHSGNKQAFVCVPRDKAAPRERPRAWMITRDEATLSAFHALEFTRVVYRLPHWTIYER